MSGKGTAVGAADCVAEGEGVGEGDASRACAPEVKHRSSKIPASHAARGASVIILTAEIGEQPADCGIIGTIAYVACSRLTME